MYRVLRSPLLRSAKATSALLLGLSLASAGSAQTYRERYPLGDSSTFDGLSVNLNLADPSEAQLQQIADAGIKFVRYDLTWTGIEGSRGVYDWLVTDRFMARAQAKGLRVMVLLAFSNPLYSNTGAPNTPTSRAAFCNFAAAAARRYAHRGIVWEIYNEPNLSGWWPNPNPVDYAALANQAAQAIRNVSSDEWIVGLSTEMIREDNRTYITAALDGGILANLDGIASHPYTSGAPETLNPKWSELLSLVESKRPANRSVSLLAGEVGYSRSWVNTSLQSTYTVRLVLNNMVQGIGLTNLYAYADEPWKPDVFATCGLVSQGTNTPYPVYNAVKRMTQSLRGYRLSKRLTLANPNDYCLLFSNPANANDCKLVVWTTDASHTITVPSSQIAFDSVVLTNGAIGGVSANAAGLSVVATGEATVYTGRTTNPLLTLAANWAALPASLTLADRADALDRLGPIVASPAWSSVPAGTTLKIEDIAAPVPGYNRPSYTTTLTNLPALTIESAPVQTMFNSLGALQDSLNKPRTLKFTVTLPDGSAVVQTASVVRKQPMMLMPTTPQNMALTLRLDNPSGAAFRGSVKATAGLLSIPMGVTFDAGETSKILYFPAVAGSALTNGVTYDLYDNSGNSLVPSDPAINGAAQIIYRLPNFMGGIGYSVRVAGTAGTAGSAWLGYGLANWLHLTGAATAEINYSFGAGGAKWVTMYAPSSVAATTFAKEPVSIGMWVCGDGSKNYMRTQFADSTGQVFQFTLGAIDWTGWKWVTVPLAGTFGQQPRWGGANDGIVHGAVKCIAPFILDSQQLGSAGRISLAGITIVGQR